MAVTVAKQLISDKLRVLGPDHPQTLAARNTLAHHLGAAGDPAGAAAEQLLADQRRVLGSDHPDTLTTRMWLDKVDAFCVPFHDRPIVALGADKGLRDRSRFDGAHELGHLIMHTADQVGSKTIETQAHQFAAAFLMPVDDIRDELPARADWPTLLKLKAKWHVSIAALLMRAKTLEVMDERTCNQAFKTMSARGWRKREPATSALPKHPRSCHARLT